MTAASAMREGSALAAFMRGLREPSATALATALCVTFALLLALAVGVDEEFMTSHRARVFKAPKADRTVDLTATMIRLRRALPAHPQIYLFGASSVNRAVDVPRLASDVRAATGQPVRVVPLTSGAQRPFEALAMISELPAGARGVVVEGVGVPSLTYSTTYLQSLVDEPRLALRLRLLEDEAARLGVATPSRSGNYFWDNRRYFLPRLPMAVARAVSATDPPAPRELLPDRAAPSGADLDGLLLRSWGPWVARGESDAMREASLGVLDRLAAAVAAHDGMRLVLLEDTIHPRHRERPDVLRLVEAFRATITEFAARRGVAFIRLQDRARIGVDDFEDAAHLRPGDGVARFTHELAIELAPVLREIRRTGR